MNCKKCKTPMEKMFSFNTDGKGIQYCSCPNCGMHTSSKTITYTEDGDVILGVDKTTKTIFAYQVSDPTKADYGEFVKITPKRKPIDKKFQSKKNGKPFHNNKNKKKKEGVR